MKERNLSNGDRQRLGLLILRNVVEEKPKKGIFDEAAELFSVTTRTVRRIWAETKRQVNQGEPLNLISKKKGKKGPAKIEFKEEIISLIPVRLRSTHRSIAKQAEVSKSTISRWIEQGLLRSHTSAVKPTLLSSNMLHRLQYILSKVNSEFNPDQKSQFSELDHVVHIEEKWFNITKTSNRYYLTTEERDPYRSCKSKRYITKVMFMCAVARPQFGPDGEELFDEKISIFLFTFEEPAVRNSMNRAAGTIVTKPIESINKTVIRQCVINQVIPAIKARWPLGSSGKITIQQDNARPHLSPTDVEFIAAANSDGFNIKLTCQPPNSPNLNVLDLGFFRAIQALQTETVSKSVEELVIVVQDAFERLEYVTLDKVFISLQACMIEIMKCRGHNDYKLPHLDKDRLMRMRQLKRLLLVDEQLVKECLRYLTDFAWDSQLDALQQLMGSED